MDTGTPQTGTPQTDGRKPSPRTTIRSFRPDDAGCCKRLFDEGRIGGVANPNEISVDIDDIETHYMKRQGNHLWVAHGPDGVIAMIAVQHHDAGAGEIRRLRMMDPTAVELANQLVETALLFCSQQQYLKVTLDTYVKRDPPHSLFAKHGYRLTESKEIEGRQVHYFYADLYAKQDK